MDQATPNYRREFLGSGCHAALGLLTLGAGFLSTSLLGLIVGATAYALGWIYLPDLGFFRRGVDRRRAERRRAEMTAQVREFARRRDAMLAALSPARSGRYLALGEVCRNIETATLEDPSVPIVSDQDPRLRKLDELMWTYLRLLTIEESLERFLEIEGREDVPRLVTEGEREVAELTGELEKARADKRGNIESRERLLGSRQERLEVLRKRLQRRDLAQQNLDLVMSEQERLDQQIKLIRADAMASKNAQNLTARIDATVAHLDQTNKWLSELDEFKDVVGDLPAADMRIGYGPVVSVPAVAAPRPPPVPQTAAHATRPPPTRMLRNQH